jgi:hypothetical protein
VIRCLRILHQRPKALVEENLLVWAGECTIALETLDVYSSTAYIDSVAFCACAVAAETRELQQLIQESDGPRLPVRAG